MNSTRVVVRPIKPGNFQVCPHCESQVKFVARNREPSQVIANVYIDEKWSRVEHYHQRCYVAAGQPHGAV